MMFQIYIKLADGNYKVYNSETDKIITVERLRKDICSFTVPKNLHLLIHYHYFLWMMFYMNILND